MRVKITRMGLWWQASQKFEGVEQQRGVLLSRRSVWRRQNSSEETFFVVTSSGGGGPPLPHGILCSRQDGERPEGLSSEKLAQETRVQ